MNRFLPYLIFCLVLSISSVSRAQPAQASNPFPANNAVDVSADVVLHWDAANGAEFYDLYVGIFEPPMYIGALTDTFYDQPFDYEINATYFWKVDTRNAVGTTEGEQWQFTTPAIAPQVTNPFPEDGATNVATDIVLSWDPSPGAWWYSVYFGESNPPDYIGFQAETEYNPGLILAENTTYYWKINPGSSGGDTQGEIWSFTTTSGGTPPDQATDPFPDNHAECVDIPFTLSWAAADRADTYDIYYGTQTEPPLLGSTTATSMQPDTMHSGSDYFWRVNSINEFGETVGELWTFTTRFIGPPVPGPATNPAPEDHAENVSVTTILSWDPADNAAAYFVDFGTQSDPPQVGTTTEITFDPGQLELGTVYYWRINPFNESGTHTGTIWMFTTDTTEAVGEQPLLPTSVALGNPYPNPFNAETTIPFTLSTLQHVALSIYDITGREITKLNDGVLSAGQYNIKWNSNTTASGVYLIRLVAGNEIHTAKILALK